MNAAAKRDSRAPAAEPAPEELIVNRFVPTVVFAKEGEGVHTRLCVYNYFSELFPEVRSGATARLWFFDQEGRALAHRAISLGYRGQLQFEVRELGFEFEGTAGLSLVPDAIPEFSHAGVGTGYYAFYYDDAGHADASHEWDPMRFTPRESAPWLCVVRPLLYPETQLVVMSAYYGEDREAGTTRWTARLRNSQGKILAETAGPPIPPRGSRRLHARALFPEIEAIARREGTISLEAAGTNMQGPFTWVTVPGGDFNLHHFC